MRVSRRTFCFGSVAVPLYAADKNGPARPDVLLLMADGLPAWVLGCYGNREIRTPNLDRLAQMGTRFLNHLVCTPAPEPSRATLLTGRTPMQLGSAGVSAAGATLEKLLGAAGYACKSGEGPDAASVLDNVSPGSPLFLTIRFRALQPPYEGVAGKYRDEYAQTRFDTVNPERAAPNARSGKEMLADPIAGLRRFAAAASALDDDVQRVLARLSERKLSDNTLVVFTSTCGSLLSHHGLWDAGDASEPVNMFEESVATPLFWTWPGHVPAQAVRPEVVGSYDLLPSLCDALSIAPPSGNLCGRSYLALATGKPLPRKQPWKTTVFGNYRNTDMARDKKYKLVVRDGGNGPGELYDLSADRAEKSNQYDNPQFLTVRNSLGAQLADWKKRYSS